MSITSEIDRIKSARNAIAIKIREKGVSLPTTFPKLDTLADYVAQIQTGGFSATDLWKFSHVKTSAYNITASTKATAVTFNHGLGVTPDGFLIVINDSNFHSGTYIEMACVDTVAGTGVLIKSGASSFGISNYLCKCDATMNATSVGIIDAWNNFNGYGANFTTSQYMLLAWKYK